MTPQGTSRAHGLRPRLPGRYETRPERIRGRADVPPGLRARRHEREFTTNHRNGTSGKTVLTDDGPLAIEVPRDREGTVEPQLIGKHERRFTGFDGKVVALYARGLTVREIQAFLKETYAVDVSPDLISAVTDAIVAEVTAWQSRPLEPLYPVVFLDALRVKIRETRRPSASRRCRISLWRCCPTAAATSWGFGEGAKFWMKVFTDLKRAAA